MSVSLLTTKFLFPPARDSLVSRPRLLERWSTGLRGPLTLLSAPAGYGKTTLLSEWRSGIGHDAPAAWLSLDGGDGDPALFLGYLAAALESLRPGLMGSTLVLLQTSQPQALDSILISLVNDLATFSEDFVLILDEFHAITAPTIHDMIAFLLAHAPPQMHLAILTREDPPLPLSKLRARGQITEIREADLRFTPEEATAFLTQTMGLTLSEKAIASLFERTEGWIAGLQMAGLSLQERSEAEEFAAAFRGQDRYVIDFLMDEVFSRQPGEIQAFLLETSILERLHGPLCDALLHGTEQDQASAPSLFPATYRTGQEILEQLEHANLFVLSLDNKRDCYRYHPLFADLLRYRLNRLQPERLPELHRRACQWYTRAGSPEDAMKHALAVPDYNLAAYVAEQFLLQMTGSSRLSAYLSWIRQLPDAVVSRRSYLCAGSGWAYVLTHQFDEAERYVTWGETALPYFEPIYSAPNERWITRDEVRGNLAAIRSYSDRGRGDGPQAIEHACQALAALPPEALAVRSAVALNLGMLHLDAGELDMAREALGEAFETASKSRTNVFVAVSALSLLGGILVMQGKLREAERWFHRAIDLGAEGARATTPIPSAGVIHGWLVAVHYLRNEMAEAQAHLDMVLQSVGQMGVPATTVRAYLYQALLAQARGEFGTADQWFQRARQSIDLYSMQDVIQTEWIVFRGQFHLAQGDSGAALELLATHKVRAADLDGHFQPGREQPCPLGQRLGCYLILARCLLAQGELDKAAALLDKVWSLSQAGTDFTVLLETLVLRAVAAARRGEAAQALSTLEHALALAAPEGYVRPFLDAGEPLPKLLRQAIAHGIQPGFAHTLHTEFAAHERQQTGASWRSEGQMPTGLGPSTAGSGQLVQPLTERERQVLRLLAAGLSSTEAAEELVISVNTARSYVKSIYTKLDVHGRDEAIERGKQTGMI